MGKCANCGDESPAVLLRLFAGKLHNLFEACEACALPLVLDKMDFVPVGGHLPFMVDIVNAEGVVLSMRGTRSNSNLTVEQVAALLELAKVEQQIPAHVSMEEVAVYAESKLEAARAADEAAAARELAEQEAAADAQDLADEADEDSQDDDDDLDGDEDADI